MAKSKRHIKRRIKRNIKVHKRLTNMGNNNKKSRYRPNSYLAEKMREYDD